MEHLTESDRKSVREQALQEIHLLDGKGLGGDHEAVEGSIETLDPDHRDRLPHACKIILNSLEHGQWSLKSRSDSGNATAPVSTGHQGESSSQGLGMPDMSA